MAEKRTKGQVMIDTNHYRVNLRFSSNIPTKNRGGGGGGGGAVEKQAFLNNM